MRVVESCGVFLAACACAGAPLPHRAPERAAHTEGSSAPSDGGRRGRGEHPSTGPAAERAQPGAQTPGWNGAPREQAASVPEATSLEVPGFEPAVLSFPATRRTREPVLVAAHGAGDVPAEQCRAWREILGDRGIILCVAGPRVAVHSEGRYFPDHFALERIVFASLESFRRAFPEIAAADRVVYAGYSQGATMGALMLPEHGATCPRLALVEGGFDGWSLRRAQAFATNGGARVLFACGTRHCRERAEASAATLRHAGVAARVVSDLSAGHTYGGAVAHVLAKSIDWLLSDDPDWN